MSLCRLTAVPIFFIIIKLLSIELSRSDSSFFFNFNDSLCVRSRNTAEETLFIACTLRRIAFVASFLFQLLKYRARHSFERICIE